MSELSRACLVETGSKSRWCARCRHICSKFGIIELVYLIWQRDAGVNGMVNLRMKAPYDTAYKRCSCHGGYKLLCK